MKLVADANVLLSALIGGRAKLVLQQPGIEHVFTTEDTLAEVEEYAVVLAEKRRLPADVLLLGIAALPVVIIGKAEYKRRIPEARVQIAHRDPDDVPLLALAVHLQLPIWSNDRDFEEVDVEVFTTEDLLRHLGIIE